MSHLNRPRRVTLITSVRKSIRFRALHSSQNIPDNPLKIQILSDLHLEFYFNKREPGGSSGYGYDIYQTIPSAPILALLGDIGLAISDELFRFLERQLKLYERVLFVMGNHEGYRSTYVTSFSMIDGVICIPDKVLSPVSSEARLSRF